MIHKPPPLKGLSIRIRNIFPIKGRGFIHQGTGLYTLGQRNSCISTLGSKYIPYKYMDPLGLEILRLKLQSDVSRLEDWRTQPKW